MNESFKDIIRAYQGNYVAWSLPYSYSSSDIRYKLLKGKVKLVNNVASCNDCVLCVNSNDIYLSCKAVKNFRENIGLKEVIYTNVNKDYPDLNYTRDYSFLINRSILFALVSIFLFRFLGSVFKRG